jgi:hypothetical protein
MPVMSISKPAYCINVPYSIIWVSADLPNKGTLWSASSVNRFSFQPKSPFTNNLAGRDIRLVNVKQKISNWFRTVTGGDINSRIEGFVSNPPKKITWKSFQNYVLLLKVKILSRI